MTSVQIVLHAYVDESYSDDWFFMAAAIGDDSGVTQFEDALNWLLIDRAELHDLQPLPELHGHELMQGKGPWQDLAEIHHRVDIAAQALELARQHRIRFMIRGIDRAAQRARYRTAYDPYPMILTHVMREVDRYAGERRTRVEVTCDEYDEHDRHRAMLVGHQTNGTPGYRRSNLEWIHGELEFVRSRDSPMIQIADLVVYLHHRFVRQAPTGRAEARTRRRLQALINASLEHEFCWVP